MTEASKEAVNALAEAGAIMFAPNNIWKAAELTAFGLEKRGYTIAPTAPVTDEKLQEAVAALWRPGVTDELVLVESALSELAQRRAEQTWQQIDKWHEDIGPCFWAKFPVDEPYYAGSPLDTDWPDYHTHFIPMSVFNHLLDSMGMPLPTPPKED